MQNKAEIKDVLRQLGSSKMGSVAYDTAWVARTVELGEPMGEEALEWLRENQLANGCWGSQSITYYHDRAICTLAATISLSQWGNKQDKKRIERARLGLETALNSLHVDISGATVGFEMLAPVLIEEAFQTGTIHRKEDLSLSVTPPYKKYHGDGRRRVDMLIEHYKNGRKKLASLPDGFVNRNFTMAFSAEMMGAELIHLLDVENLQEENGSLGCSPSATAYFALNVKHGDDAALAYLRNLTSRESSCQKGGFPVVAPFDLFEITWALWNLALPEQLDQEIAELCKPYLNVLNNAWDNKKGFGFSVEYSPTDGDDTGMAYDVLKRYGYDVDINALLRYKRNDHFHCYETEADPSMSANIHALGAIKQADIPASDPIVQNIISFLNEKQLCDAFWDDKWHASPYYATSHAIIVGAGYLPDESLQSAANWIISTQRSDGSWGYYSASTAEETSYALQALLIWKRNGGNTPKENIKKGLQWLEEHSAPPYQPLWICKTLYAPELIIRSTISSALLLGEELV